MKALTRKLRPSDQIAIVTYNSTAQRVLAPTPCSSADTICGTIDSLNADGSTNGAGGIELAYAAAKEQFFEGGLNRVILATDGDFNVGETENAALVQRIQDHAKSGVFLTVLRFGVDNLKDDRLEALADKGNGNYYYIDSFAEANRVLVERMAGTIAVAAKDVKIQVEFNPAKIGAYRLLGYENRAGRTGLQRRPKDAAIWRGSYRRAVRTRACGCVHRRAGCRCVEVSSRTRCKRATTPKP